MTRESGQAGIDGSEKERDVISLPFWIFLWTLLAVFAGFVYYKLNKEKGKKSVEHVGTRNDARIARTSRKKITNTDSMKKPNFRSQTSYEIIDGEVRIHYDVSMLDDSLVEKTNVSIKTEVDSIPPKSSNLDDVEILTGKLPLIIEEGEEFPDEETLKAETANCNELFEEKSYQNYGTYETKIEKSINHHNFVSTRVEEKKSESEGKFSTTSQETIIPVIIINDANIIKTSEQRKSQFQKYGSACSEGDDQVGNNTKNNIHHEESRPKTANSYALHQLTNNHKSEEKQFAGKRNFDINVVTSALKDEGLFKQVEGSIFDEGSHDYNKALLVRDEDIKDEKIVQWDETVHLPNTTFDGVLSAQQLGMFENEGKHTQLQTAVKRKENNITANAVTTEENESIPNVRIDDFDEELDSRSPDFKENMYDSHPDALTTQNISSFSRNSVDLEDSILPNRHSDKSLLEQNDKKTVTEDCKDTRYVVPVLSSDLIKSTTSSHTNQIQRLFKDKFVSTQEDSSMIHLSCEKEVNPGTPSEIDINFHQPRDQQKSKSNTDLDKLSSSYSHLDNVNMVNIKSTSAPNIFTTSHEETSRNCPKKNFEKQLSFSSPKLNSKMKKVTKIKIIHVKFLEMPSDYDNAEEDLFVHKGNLPITGKIKRRSKNFSDDFEIFDNSPNTEVGNPQRSYDVTNYRHNDAIGHQLDDVIGHQQDDVRNPPFSDVLMNSKSLSSDTQTMNGIKSPSNVVNVKQNKTDSRRSINGHINHEFIGNKRNVAHQTEDRECKEIPDTSKTDTTEAKFHHNFSTYDTTVLSRDRLSTPLLAQTYDDSELPSPLKNSRHGIKLSEKFHISDDEYVGGKQAISTDNVKDNINVEKRSHGKQSCYGCENNINNFHNGKVVAVKSGIISDHDYSSDADSEMSYNIPSPPSKGKRYSRPTTRRLYSDSSSDPDIPRRRISDTVRSKNVIEDERSVSSSGYRNLFSKFGDFNQSKEKE